MQKNELLQLIDDKLAQLNEAEKATKWDDKLRYGVHLNLYRQSPFMEAFLKKRKNVQRQILFATFAIPILVFLWDSGFYEQWEQNPWKVVVMLLVNTLFSGLIIIYGLMRSVARTTNSAQSEVKKMMLFDLRQKVEQMEG